MTPGRLLFYHWQLFVLLSAARRDSDPAEDGDGVDSRRRVADSDDAHDHSSVASQGNKIADNQKITGDCVSSFHQRGVCPSIRLTPRVIIA
jgi:hypothetical protein